MVYTTGLCLVSVMTQAHSLHGTGRAGPGRAYSVVTELVLKINNKDSIQSASSCLKTKASSNHDAILTLSCCQLTFSACIRINSINRPRSRDLAIIHQH